MPRKNNPPLHIDMELEEALERFAGVDAGELPDNIKLARKRKAGSETQPPASTGGKLRNRKARGS